MSRIIELPEILANQIAAGEVIERPASVVKELVENAIDAGANQIIVEIEEAGLKSIKVTDNGEGMKQEDVALSLRRHATSKIKKQSDLFRIRTLGFRGEALPSVASVSRLSIETFNQEDPSGTRLTANGGKIDNISSVSVPVGTKIKVEDLFFNTPARLKYLKSLQAEQAHIIDVINRLSLGHPDIAFTLLNDGRDLIKTVGNGDLRQTIAGIYGLQVARKMVEINQSNLDFEVSGYVSLPDTTRANRHYITLLINGRYIKNFLLNRAVIEGYGSKLMVGRFPIAVIDIQIDPYLADVNVHPTKQEVRLSKEKDLMQLIQLAIKESLREQELIPDALENLAKSSVKKIQKSTQISFPLTASVAYPEKFDNLQEDIVAEKKQIDIIDRYVGNGVNENQKIKVADRNQLEDSLGNLEHPDFDWSSKSSHKQVDKAIERLTHEKRSNFPELEYFGQMHGTYLFAQGQSGLYIIDQHAAQERIKYEYYREKIGQVGTASQQLLMPYLFEFPQDNFIRIKEKISFLEDVGIILEDYGPNTFILREHPIWFKENEIESGVYEMCDMLLLTNEISVKRYRAELAIMMSCKRSIKANHSLDDYSARHLIEELSQCQNPYNCPHGRPVLIHFSRSDMEKMFRRIQENHDSLRDFGKYE